MDTMDKALRRAFAARPVPAMTSDLESRLERAAAGARRQARAALVLLAWTSATAFVAGLLMAVQRPTVLHLIAVFVGLALAVGVWSVASAPWGPRGDPT